MSGSRSATVAPAVEILQVVELSGLVLNSLVCSEYHTPISSMRRVRLLRLWFISLESENEQTINKRNNKTMQRVNSRGETSSLLSKNATSSRTVGQAHNRVLQKETRDR